MLLEVTDIQRGCTHDGPGLRTTVFFKGCPLHCKWCHNPETQRVRREVFFRADKCIGCMKCMEACEQGAHILKEEKHALDADKCIGCMKCAQVCPAGALEAASKPMTVERIAHEVCLDRTFYRRRGGMTVSGGEPTLHRQGVMELLRTVKNEGISTCMETCGVFPEDMIPDLLANVDLFLYDIKDTDALRLQENTEAKLEQVISNLMRIDAGGGKSVMRCILIPDVNLNDAHAQALVELYGKLRNCAHIELLPYHPYGLSKTEQLGRSGTQYRQPEKDEILRFAQVLQARNVPVKVYGTML